MSVFIKPPTIIERALGKTSPLVDIPNWDGLADGYLIDAPVKNGRILLYPITTAQGKVIRQALDKAVEGIVGDYRQLATNEPTNTELSELYGGGIEELFQICRACKIDPPPHFLAVHATVQRSRALFNVYSSLEEIMQNKTMMTGILHYLVDVLTDDGRLIAIYNIGGVYYSAEVVSNDIGVSLSDSQVLDLGVTNSRTFSAKEPDGRYRFLSISATSALNRDKEIDSSLLFSNIERRWKAGGEPELTLDIYHLGEKARLGTVDYVRAEKNTLITSWRFDDDPIGRAAEAELIKDPDYWGHSIEYYPLGYIVDWVDSFPIPVYTDGFLVRISLCAEEKGANLFTSVITRSKHMPTLQDDILKLMGGDTELVTRFMSKLEETETTIQTLVYRTKSDEDSHANDTAIGDQSPPADPVIDQSPDVAPPAVAASTDDAPPPVESVIELDEDGIQQIATAMVNLPSFTGIIAGQLNSVMATLSGQLEATLRQTLEAYTANTVNTQIAPLLGRVSALEGETSRLADMPSPTTVSGVRRVVTRPSETPRAVGDVDATGAEIARTSSDIAQSTLDAIPKPPGF